MFKGKEQDIVTDQTNHAEGMKDKEFFFNNILEKIKNDGFSEYLKTEPEETRKELSMYLEKETIVLRNSIKTKYGNKEVEKFDILKNQGSPYNPIFSNEMRIYLKQTGFQSSDYKFSELVQILSDFDTLKNEYGKPDDLTALNDDFIFAKELNFPILSKNSDDYQKLIRGIKNIISDDYIDKHLGYYKYDKVIKKIESESKQLDPDFEKIVLSKDILDEVSQKIEQSILKCKQPEDILIILEKINSSIFAGKFTISDESKIYFETRVNDKIKKIENTKNQAKKIFEKY